MLGLVLYRPYPLDTADRVPIPVRAACQSDTNLAGPRSCLSH